VFDASSPMIETRWVKVVVVLTFFSLSVVLAVNASPWRRHIAYPLAAGLALFAAYVLVRVKIPEPRPTPPPGSALGDVDSFLADIPSVAERFHVWAGSLGLGAVARPADLREWIWEHRDAIGDDWDTLFRPTVAAYGECLRKSDPRAVWSKRNGDVVVEIPGRPWSRTWVATEVSETLDVDI